MVNCRILYLIGQLDSGGSERQLYYLLESMDRSRYRPAVAVWNFSEKEIYVARIRELGVPIYSLSDASLASAKLRALRKLVRELQPEIVHSLSFYLNFGAHWSVQSTEAIALGSTRTNFLLDWNETGWWLGRASARWPRNQVYNSAEAAETVRRRKRLFAPARVFVVRNGVDLEHFRNLPLPLHSQARMLGVGSLLPVKRWDRVLLAGAELKQRGLNFLIRVVGEGPLRQWLENYAQRLGLQDRVELPGHANDISSLLSNTTFLVHPSESEGCPNVVIEAMACGRAVIATDVGDIPALVEDGKTGFVVRGGDNAMLVDRMVKLITDRDLCRRMGEAGRVKAEREFGLERLVSETLAAYRVAGWKDC